MYSSKCCHSWAWDTTIRYVLYYILGMTSNYIICPFFLVSAHGLFAFGGFMVHNYCGPW